LSVAEQVFEELSNIRDKYVRRKYADGFCRCLDCVHRDKLVPNRSRFGENGRDKFCKENINGVVLLNAMRNDQALTAWRRCGAFVLNGKEATK